MPALYIGEKKGKENQSVGLKIGEVEVKWNARGKNIAEEIVQAEERLRGIRKKQKTWESSDQCWGEQQGMFLARSIRKLNTDGKVWKADRPEKL